jgi:hypothetical protein
MLSIIFLSIAANIKITPLIFSLFYIFDKRWKLFFQFIAVTFILCVISFFFVKLSYPPYSLEEWKKGLEAYYKAHVFYHLGGGYSTTLFILIRVIMIAINRSPTIDQFHALSFNYTIVTLICFTLMIALLYFKKYSEYQKVILLTCFMLLAPHVIAEYYLSLLLFPLMYCFADPVKSRYKEISIFLILLAGLPKSFVLPTSLSFMTGSFITPIILIVLFIINLKPIKQISS